MISRCPELWQGHRVKAFFNVWGIGHGGSRESVTIYAFRIRHKPPHIHTQTHTLCPQPGVLQNSSCLDRQHRKTLMPKTPELLAQPTSPQVDRTVRALRQSLTYLCLLHRTAAMGMRQWTGFSVRLRPRSSLVSGSFAICSRFLISGCRPSHKTDLYYTLHALAPSRPPMCGGLQEDGEKITTAFQAAQILLQNPAQAHPDHCIAQVAFAASQDPNAGWT